MATAFNIETENVGTEEVLVRVLATAPVEFIGGMTTANANERIYQNGQTVRFRVGDGEIINTMALRKSFSMASRFNFERGV